MTRIVTTNIITTADGDDAIDDGGQPIFIVPGVVVGAQGASAFGVYAATGGLALTVGGHIYAGHAAVSAGAETANFLQVLASGTISSGSSLFAAIQSLAGMELYNAGSIAGRSYGVELSSGGGGHYISNSGIIQGGFTGIAFSSPEGTMTTIVNSGSIIGDTNAIIGSSATNDILINSGFIAGRVTLGGGDDSIDSRDGRIVGIIEGGVGNDVIYGSLAAANDMSGGSGDDLLQGGNAADRIEGGIGADEIDGGNGIDTASYRLTNAGVTVDLRDNGANAGDAAGDMLVSMENILGGAHADRLFGDTGANQLQGAAGTDILDGREGNDKLYGGTGADSMTGGLGNDVFWVDDIADIVRELANQGTDEVRSSVSYSIAGQQIERLTLLGATAIDGTGNALDNILIGNDQANMLTGGTGRDVLTGKGGADQFLFFGQLGASNVDTITDFMVGTDKIVLDRSFFPQVNAPGALNPDAFDTDGLPDANDRILYDAATGIISYDPDGSGAGVAVVFGMVTPGLGLTAGDFLIVA